MAIQNDNTLVTKGDLKALYSDKIAPYLGQNLALKTNVSDYYSTDEKIIGVWTDGKPLYQKTINIGALANVSNYTDKLVSVGASVDTYVKADMLFGSAEWLSSEYQDSQYAIYVSNYTNAEPSSASKNKAGVMYKGNMSWVTICFITIQYTKTTDAANSAVTTPGCYDINFPNAWPANKEIYFGNGLYGYRATGNYTAEMPESSTNWCSVVNKNIGFSTNYPTIEWGGNLQIYSGDNAAVVNQPLNVRRSNNFFSCSFISATGLLRINACSTTGAKIKVRTQDKYDIWFTYTK